jgi:hypothetical protein
VARRPAALRELEQQARGLGGTIDDALKEAIGKYPLLRDMLYQEPFFDLLNDEQLRDLVFQIQTTRDSAGEDAKDSRILTQGRPET